jgi:uncharacterized protein (TIGR03435 family)
VEQFASHLPHIPGVDRPVLDKSVFTAIEEQLGLRLETQRAPIAILVVDHAEKMPRD